MRSDPRKRIFVDPKVQRPLLVRVLVYWALCVVTTTLLLAYWHMTQAPVWEAFEFKTLAPALVAIVAASLLLLPAILIDTVMVSSRFAGPVLRVRRAMRALAAGGRVQSVHFRDNDLWHDMADDFNLLLAHVEVLRRQANARNRDLEVKVDLEEELVEVPTT